MLKRIKQKALESAKNFGVFDVWHKSQWRRSKLLILAYHGVSIDDEHEWNPALYVTQEFLRTRFQTIKDGGYTVLPLAEASARLREGALPEKAIAITFDDGNHDFYTRAFPVIREFDFPVTVYLTTYYSLYNKPVFDVACPYILWKSRDKILDLSEIVGRDAQFDLKNDPAREAAYQAIAQHAKRKEFSAEEKNNLLVVLAKRLQFEYRQVFDRRLLHIMKPDEAAEISTQGIDVQLHTHRHRTPLDRILFEREIEDNRRVIEDITNKPTAHFCYPSGIYEKEFLEWLAEMRIETATTCNPGIAARASDQLLLPRLVDSASLAPVEFEGWLAGVSALLPQRSGWGHRPQEE